MKTKTRVRTEYSAGGIVFRKLKREHAERAGSPAQRGGTLSVPICPAQRGGTLSVPICPAQRGGIEVAFILDPYDKWTFPKGHIEKGESIPRAAVRETKEEIGIGKIRIIAPLGRIDWWFRKNRRTGYVKSDERIHKFSYYFLMQTPYQTQLRAQKSEFIKAARWVPLEQAFELSSYKDIAPVLKKAIDILKRVK